MCKNIWKTFEECSKVLMDVHEWLWLKLYYNVHKKYQKCSKMFGIVKKCSKMFEKVHKCKKILKILKTYKNNHKCLEMLKMWIFFQNCLKMPKNT